MEYERVDRCKRPAHPRFHLPASEAQPRLRRLPLPWGLHRFPQHPCSSFRAQEPSFLCIHSSKRILRKMSVHVVCTDLGVTVKAKCHPPGPPASEPYVRGRTLGPNAVPRGGNTGFKWHLAPEEATTSAPVLASLGSCTQTCGSSEGTWPTCPPTGLCPPACEHLEARFTTNSSVP